MKSSYFILFINRFQIFFTFVSISGVAQIEQVPIVRDALSSSQNINARTVSLPAKALPFWDDFSFNNSNYYPNANLWEDSQSVWVNNGTGINPPSFKVATFDGYDFLGKPYSVNDVLAKGFADKLTSGPLKLGDVPTNLRSAVFMSFFYQFTGNGDPPEPGDILSLLFKNNTGVWKPIWSIENKGTLKPDQFVEISIPIVGNEYFHNDFQFRFQNFGRLSGPFDTWNIDYIYLSNGKQQYDPQYKNFPDRVIVTPFTSLLGAYTSMPVKHFFANPLNKLVKSSWIVSNQSKEQVAPGQPIPFKSKATIASKNQGSNSFVLEDGSTNSITVPYNSLVPFSLNVIPDLAPYKNEKDSLTIVLEVTLNSGDNDIKRKEVDNSKPGSPIVDKGDYDTIIYKGIDFRSNDIMRDTFSLTNYYAYDDGEAEYGAKINGVGTQLAYQFDMKTGQRDTIVAVDFYFPKFGDESNQFIQLQIMQALEGKDSDYLFKQNIALVRSTRDKFSRVEIPAGVSVQSKFYVGWKLNSNAEIPVGLDRNTESGNKIFVNAAGTWEQNLILKGSLMIRPVFGKTKNVTTGVQDPENSNPYPNPSYGTFFLPSNAEQIHLYNLNGKEINFERTEILDKTEIKISNPSSGLYLIRYFDKNWQTKKIIVLP